MTQNAQTELIIEQVADGIHRLEVPLPNNPLKSVNVYILKSDGRDLIVDTGMNRPECQTVVDAGLAELNVDLDKADLFITHLHADHVGLVSHLSRESSTVYFNQIEADQLASSKKSGGFMDRMKGFAAKAGFTDEEMKESLSQHPGMRFHAPEHPHWTIVGEGDIVEVGQYRFRCIHTPGHSTGHLCLYDETRKVLLAGDHVLGDISPNISSWTEHENPLGDYLASLDKVYGLDVELVLPGHRSVFTTFRKRVDELREHHEERLDEVAGILDGTSLSAYDVAARMKWRVRANGWDDMPVMQKWFASGEAFAHLKYLEVKGVLGMELREGRILFSK